MSKRKPHNHLPGYMAERRNRVTGAYTAIVDQSVSDHEREEIVKAWGLDDAASNYLQCCHRYVVICTHHRIASSAPSMPKARELLKDPASFCDRCSAQDVVCRRCEGTGQVGEAQDVGGGLSMTSRCQDCDGDGQRRVPCRFCDRPTKMTGTKECDNCHEVRVRIQGMDRSLVSRIVEYAHPELDVVGSGYPADATTDYQLSRGAGADPAEGGVPGSDEVTRRAEDGDAAGSCGPF